MFCRIDSKSVFTVLSLSTDMQSSTDLYWWAPNQCIKLGNSTQMITNVDLNIQAAERGNPGAWSVWLTSLKRCIRACYHIIYDNSAKSQCSNLLFLIMSLKHMLPFLESKFTCPVCSQRFTKLRFKKHVASGTPTKPKLSSNISSSPVTDGKGKISDHSQPSTLVF